jgi:serpin B
VAIVACSKGATPPPAICSAPQGTSADAKTLAAADTSFAISLYAPTIALEGSGTGKNVVFSPYGVSATMTMLDAGAAGETAAQMKAALDLPSAGATLAPAYAALACDDETDGQSSGNQLSIANALFVQKGESFVPAFLSLLSSGYDAPLQQVDFEDDAAGATSTINQWASNETEGMVQALFNPGDLDADTRLVVANAIYFKGAWDTAFVASATQPRPFTLADGTVVSATTMDNPNAVVGLSHTDAFDVVELPYKGGSMAMDFVVPNDSLASLEATLTPALLAPALTFSTHSAVELFLPKFSFSTRSSLATVLSGMGMTDAFDPAKADFSGIDGAMDLYVKLVVQQALIEVDEEGTVAVAATSSGTESGSAEELPLPLHIDHPFLFLLRDVGTGSILFMGRVEDPTAM